NDIQRATELARNMVTKWGLSERLGPLTYSEEEGEVFLGHSVTRHKAISDETTHIIDQEVRSIIDRNYERAEELLKANIDKLHMMAEALIRYETLESEQISDIMEGREPRPPEGWDDDGSPGEPATAAEAQAKSRSRRRKSADHPPVSGPKPA